ncbi:hypothetical protein WICPIJ_001517 [Wickerhamomyces pijperi]|uniref:Uncharacterized protein n=1 Tax=Wickerhamomyces pijperi TaxID=599730 RepID=A0A9P8TR20_WICPI|nr:hypothetical protein WICPIJ_001517 [Wickerhamomyces pijperi]
MAVGLATPWPWMSKPTTNVGQDGTVQVRSDQDIELLWVGGGLHGGVVDDDVLGDDFWVLLSTDGLNGLSEQTVSQLHDVGLVDSGDLLSAVLLGEVEGELGDSLGLVLGDDLQGFNDTWDRFVFQTGVLTFGVFSDKNQVDTFQLGLDTWDVLDQGQGGVDV